MPGALKLVDSRTSTTGVVIADYARAEIVETYAARTGLSVTPEQWRFYEVFGLFRMAVIAQQIYYRYFHGQTTNEMYALFGPAVQIIGRRLDGLIAGDAA